jgi:hypothetical protein
MSGEALTMRNVGTLHLLLQFLRSHLAGGNLGASKSLDELPATQTGDLRAPPLRNQAAAVEVDCGDTKDLSTELFRSLAEVLQEGIRHVDCDGHRFSLAQICLYRERMAANTPVRRIVYQNHSPRGSKRRLIPEAGIQ